MPIGIHFTSSFLLQLYLQLIAKRFITTEEILVRELATIENYCVLAGDWEHSVQTAEDRPLLSVETRMRIGGMAVVAAHQEVEHVIYTGGLSVNGMTEATGMLHYTEQTYPALAARASRFHLDGSCYDTASSAQNVLKIVQDCEISGPIGFITSKTHMQRALTAFHRNGFEGDQLVAVTAEQLLLQGTPTQQEMAGNYLSSLRYRKRQLIEGVLRGVAAIDPDYRITQNMARRVRKNRGGLSDPS